MSTPPAFTEQSLGKRGSVVVDDTSMTNAVAGNFAIIVAGPRGCTLETVVCSNKSNGFALTGSLPAGYTSYGNFTSLQVSDGELEAYNA